MSKLIVISSPSGGGKTSIVNELLKNNPKLKFSISATTRAKRPNEISGREYFFIAKDEFENLIEKNELAEYEEIYGNFYGTLKSEIVRSLKDNSPMLFDVDVKGALSIKKCYPVEAALIFIAPPSLEELKNRLKNRNTESDETIKKRMSRAEFEIDLGKKFDFTVVNNLLDEAVEEVEKIVKKLIYPKGIH